MKGEESPLSLRRIILWLVQSLPKQRHELLLVFRPTRDARTWHRHFKQIAKQPIANIVIVIVCYIVTLEIQKVKSF